MTTRHYIEVNQVTHREEITQEKYNELLASQETITDLLEQYSQGNGCWITDSVGLITDHRALTENLSLVTAITDHDEHDIYVQEINTAHDVYIHEKHNHNIPPPVNMADAYTGHLRSNFRWGRITAAIIVVCVCLGGVIAHFATEWLLT